jgi:hypothetical protein
LKFLFKYFNIWLKVNLPSSIYDFGLFVWLRNYLHSFVVFVNQKDKKKDGEGAAKEGDATFRGSTEASNQGV